MTLFRNFKYFILAFFLILPNSGLPQADGAPQRLLVSRVIIETETGSLEFEAEMAITWEQQRMGLMFRREMAENRGMLFYYPSPQKVSFWMKNTYLPLDIIFIRSGGEITSIARDTVPHSLNPVGSEGLITGVFEINAGLTEKLGIREGDLVRHEIFRNILGESDE
ncbi:MAG: DUF192 domain-containing protein [Proteobacteria bacterium]|nr:DUF192 domain-containing protein [Pseudomonadota bacterium]